MVISHKNFSCVVSQINEAEILYRVAGAMGGGTGGVGGQCPPHFWDQRGTGGYRVADANGCRIEWHNF